MKGNVGYQIIETVQFLGHRPQTPQSPFIGPPGMTAYGFQTENSGSFMGFKAPENC